MRPHLYPNLDTAGGKRAWYANTWLTRVFTNTYSYALTREAKRGQKGAERSGTAYRMHRMELHEARLRYVCKAIAFNQLLAGNFH